jgi:hypothetical protein
MLVLTEKKRLDERGTVYTEVSRKEALLKLMASMKQSREFQARFGFMNCVSFIEARYNKVKITGTEIKFRDVRNVNNRLDLVFRDIIAAEIGEDPDVDFITFRFDLKTKSYITITPF